jgi:predicted transcriptional regulator
MLSIYMPNVLIFLDPAMARALERAAPAKGRQRSRFIRLAIQKALMELEDIETDKAYARMPDNEADFFDPAVWDAWRPNESQPPARVPARTRKKR